MFLEVAASLILFGVGFLIGHALKREALPTVKNIKKMVFPPEAYIAGSEEDVEIMEEGQEYKLK